MHVSPMHCNAHPCREVRVRLIKRWHCTIAVISSIRGASLFQPLKFDGTITVRVIRVPFPYKHTQSIYLPRNLFESLRVLSYAMIAIPVSFLLPNSCSGCQDAEPSSISLEEQATALQGASFGLLGTILTCIRHWRGPWRKIHRLDESNCQTVQDPTDDGPRLEALIFANRSPFALASRAVGWHLPNIKVKYRSATHTIMFHSSIFPSIE